MLEEQQMRSSTNSDPIRQLKAKTLSKLLKFIGPGFVVAVGYLDPGNWATDLEAGSKYQYALLFFVLVSNVMALVMQYLAVKLGIVSGLDLAQACRKFLPKWLNLIFYALAEIAIISTDLAEVIGSSIALNLLFDLPLYLGVIITSLNIFIILLFYNSRSIRAFELIIIALVLVVGTMFILELFWVKPDPVDVLKGFLPPPPDYWQDPRVLYIGMGIVGATVMPHNLFLHSNLVKNRAHKHPATGITCSTHRTPSFVREILRYTFADCFVALTFAVFVNAAILVVSGSAFYGMDVAGLFKAYELLANPDTGPGPVAATVFALALLLAGQSSTFTATLGGQVVMEGFLGLRIKPWVRRLITRSIAIIPAMFVALSGASARKEMNNLLVLSQVALSIQLPFCVIPLLIFTGSKKIMRLKQGGRRPSLHLQSRSASSTGISCHCGTSSTIRAQLGHSIYGKQRVNAVRRLWQWAFNRKRSQTGRGSRLQSPILYSTPATPELTNSVNKQDAKQDDKLKNSHSAGTTQADDEFQPLLPTADSNATGASASGIVDQTFLTAADDESVSGSSSTSVFSVSSDSDTSLDSSDEEALLNSFTSSSVAQGHGFARTHTLGENEGSQLVLACNTGDRQRARQAFQDDLERDFANHWPLQIIAWTSGLTVLAFNILLLKDLF